MESLRGKLLIAGPGLFDPNFRRTIVLVGEHNEEGALGVVLNRSTEVTVEEVAPPLAGLVGPNTPLYVGGPVQPESAVVVAEFEDPDAAGLLVFGRVGFLIGDVALADAASVVRARVFAGYTGWGPGQLETELEEGSWIVEPASEDDVFPADPSDLWSRILRRKGGRFAMMAVMPFDPSTN